MEQERHPIIFCHNPETNTWHSPYGAWTVRFRPGTTILELVGPHAQVPTYLCSDGDLNDALELCQDLIEAHHERLERKPRPRIPHSEDELSPVDRLVRRAGGNHRRGGNKLMSAFSG